MAGRTGVVALGACLAVLFGAPAARAQSGRFIVKYRDVERGREAVRSAGGSLALDLGPQRAAAAHLSAAGAASLRSHPEVEYVVEDARRFPLAQVLPPGIDLVQAPRVWPRATGAGRTVCLVDSGLGVGHEDLQRQDLTGYPRGWSSDACGHGTHVAGIVAALDNALGVVGTVPGGLRMHVVRVFGDDCSWTYASTLVDAVNRCRSAGAHVINMSLGGPASNVFEEWALRDAYDAGVLLVAAAGNGGSQAYSYPASYPSVVSVAAVDGDKQLAWFSQRNSRVELSAPGVDVLSTVPWAAGGGAGSSYESWSGTSMATPHVSGVAALVWSAQPAWSNAQIRAALRASAEDLGPAGRDDGYGYGLVRAQAALDHLLGTGGAAPAASFRAACDGLSCQFTDTSTDPDGDLAAWTWSFGDGGLSSERHPAHTYAAEGSHSVSLTVTDARGLSSTASQSVEVQPAPAITLTARPSKVRRERRVDLAWSGLADAGVDVFRDGALLDTTANDGAYTDVIGTRQTTFVYRVCGAGTTRCSREVSVSF